MLIRACKTFDVVLVAVKIASKAPYGPCINFSPQAALKYSEVKHTLTVPNTGPFYSTFYVH